MQDSDRKKQTSTCTLKRQTDEVEAVFQKLNCCFQFRVTMQSEQLKVSAAGSQGCPLSNTFVKQLYRGAIDIASQ